MASSKWSSFVEQLKHNSPIESDEDDQAQESTGGGPESGGLLSEIDSEADHRGDSGKVESPTSDANEAVSEPEYVAVKPVSIEPVDPGKDLLPVFGQEEPKDAEVSPKEEKPQDLIAVSKNPISVSGSSPGRKVESLEREEKGKAMELESGRERTPTPGVGNFVGPTVRSGDPKGLRHERIGKEISNEAKVPGSSSGIDDRSSATRSEGDTTGKWSGFLGGAFSGGGRDDVAFAIGSDRVYLASRNRPEVVAYEAVVALTREGGELVALGKEAETMRGREPQNIVTQSVLKNGMVVDPARFAEFLRTLLKQHFQSRRYLRPRIVCAGNFPTPLAKRGTTDAILEAGAREVSLCDPEIAAAKGLGVDMSRPELISVLLIENDWVGSVVASMGNSVSRLSTFAGQDAVLEDISLHLQETQGFSPRLKSLEEAFVEEGFEGTLQLDGWEAWGDQLEKGRPKKLEVSGATCREAVRHYFLRLKHRIHKSLEPLDRDRRWNVQNAPIYFAGSCSNIPGFASLVGDVLNRKVVSSPEGSWAMGHGLVELLSDKAFLALIRAEA